MARVVKEIFNLGGLTPIHRRSYLSPQEGIGEKIPVMVPLTELKRVGLLKDGVTPASEYGFIHSNAVTLPDQSRGIKLEVALGSSGFLELFEDIYSDTSFGVIPLRRIQDPGEELTIFEQEFGQPLRRGYIVAAETETPQYKVPVYQIKTHIGGEKTFIAAEKILESSFTPVVQTLAGSIPNPQVGGRFSVSLLTESFPLAGSQIANLPGITQIEQILHGFFGAKVILHFSILGDIFVLDKDENTTLATYPLSDNAVKQQLTDGLKIVIENKEGQKVLATLSLIGYAEKYNKFDTSHRR